MRSSPSSMIQSFSATLFTKYRSCEMKSIDPGYSRTARSSDSLVSASRWLVGSSKMSKFDTPEKLVSWTQYCIASVDIADLAHISSGLFDFFTLCFQARVFCDRRAKRSRDRSHPERLPTILPVSANSNPYVDMILPIRSRE